MICPECKKPDSCPTCNCTQIAPIYVGDGPGDPGGVPTGEFICQWCGAKWKFKCAQCGGTRIEDSHHFISCKDCHLPLHNWDQKKEEMSESQWDTYFKEMQEGRWNPSEFLNYANLEELRSEVLSRGYDLHSIGCPRDYDYDQPIKRWPGSDPFSGCPSPVDSCCLISASLYLDWEYEIQEADKRLEEWEYPFGTGKNEFVCAGCGTRWKRRYGTWNEVDS